MGKFEILEGYETEYNNMLKNELDRLIEKKQSVGITYKEDNLVFQIKTHLGIEVDLLSQRKTTAADKDIGIESYN